MHVTDSLFIDIAKLIPKNKTHYVCDIIQQLLNSINSL